MRIRIWYSDGSHSWRAADVWEVEDVCEVPATTVALWEAIEQASEEVDRQLAALLNANEAEALIKELAKAERTVAALNKGKKGKDR